MDEDYQYQQQQQYPHRHNQEQHYYSPPTEETIDQFNENGQKVRMSTPTRTLFSLTLAFFPGRHHHFVHDVVLSLQLQHV
jgi:hypothetical protein